MSKGLYGFMYFIVFITKAGMKSGLWRGRVTRTRQVDKESD
jgi:hypothetical protein